MEKYNDYIKDALDVINWDIDTTLDKEEAYYIKESLGEPLECCYPIYIITVGSEESEKIVYIRKNIFKN